MLSSSDVDAVTMLLAAEVKKAQGDTKSQRNLLDRAVQRFPSDATVFMKRGQSVLETADSLPEADRTAVVRDAIADLTKAIQLNPTMAQALRMRALAHDKLKDTNKAMADLRAALDVNPFDNELLGGLVSLLLKENRDQDALEVANRVLEKRQRDAGAFIGLASIFASAGRHDHAIRYMERAFLIDPQDAVAINFLSTLLNANPPATQQAQALFDNQLKTRVANNPGLLMARAKLYFLQNKNADSLRAARDSLALLNVDDARQMHVWFGEVRRFSTDTQKVRRFLEDLVQGGVATEWLAFFRGSMMVDEPAVQTQGLDILKDLRGSQNKSLRQYAHRGYTGALYNLGRYEEAATAMQGALTDYPDDLEVMNNLAYTLAKRLNKAQEALPLAEKAAKARPTGDVLDTLAMCHLLMGKHEEALTQLQKAEGMQLSPNGAVSVQIHKAEALWALNRKDEAKSTLTGAVKIAENNPAAMSPQAKSDLEEVRKRIGTP
jgi:tetratricopeptide (TPR) repeat protein